MKGGVAPLENEELLLEGDGLQPEPVPINDVRAEVSDRADKETGHDRSFASELFGPGQLLDALDKAAPS